MRRRISVFLALTVLSTLLYAGAARAATFTVTNTSDSGPGSLREAIEQANANASADKIVFADGVSGTITLNSSLPTITDPAGLTIDGGGDVTLSGNGNVRPVEVASEAKLAVRNLTISDGEVRGGGAHGGGDVRVVGGGILNDGILTLTNSTISNNLAILSRGSGFGLSAGGGIYNSGTLTLTSSTISGNEARSPRVSSAGGGIYNSGTLTLRDSTVSNNLTEGGVFSTGGGGVSNSGTLTLRNSTVSNNVTDGSFPEGGGISNYDTLTIIKSTVSDNVAGGGEDHFGDGGGISNYATLEVIDSTISGNSAFSNGGGIHNFGYWGTSTVTNSTFTGNDASQGGGIYIEVYEPQVDTPTLTNSTFSGNSATNEFGGGGVYIYEGDLVLSNTIVANSPSGMDCSSGSFDNTIIDRGYNIVETDNCGFTQGTGSLPNTDPLLDPDGLQDNGGSTKTIALQPDSPAVDLVGKEACPPPKTDQRGVERPQGAACDSGAYELEQQAEPKTKADCKKGGYEEFGFKNQGRCIAFVNRAASNR